jgi:peptidyl-prolyl cis-trans isomerase SurA
MILRAALALLCSTFFLPLSAQQKKHGSSSGESPIVFTVNKKPVSASEFIYLYRKNHQNPTEDYTLAKIEEYLNLYINFKLKVEEARKRGMDTTSAFRKEFNQYKEELRKPYLPGNGLADSLVRVVYERMKEEVHAAHILVSVTPDAAPEDTLRAFNRIAGLRDRIKGGEDFSVVAQQYSEDPSARVNQGDLGYFTALQMVYPFENAAYTTRKGQVSEPFRTRFGYHILKVIDRRPAKGEVEVSHIMIRAGEERSTADARNVIFSVYDQLQAGVSWSELCKQYSDDPGTRDAGGKLRPFRSGMMANVPEFERVAFELQDPGQVSDPFETQYGWHIMRLERKIPLGSFEEMAPGLKTRVSRDERTQISKQQLQSKLRSELGFQEITRIKNALLKQPDSAFRGGRWREAFAGKAGKQTLFTLRGRPFSVSGFLSYSKGTPLLTASAAEQLYQKFVDESILQLQEEKIIQKQPEYQYLLNEYYEGILLFEIMEKEVWTKASEDSVGQRRYFESRRNDFTAGERARATIFSGADESALNGLRDLLHNEADNKVTEFAARNRIKAESGYFKKDEKAVLKLVPWTKGIHNANTNGLYYLAWLKEILPAGVMSFEEARPALISDYQDYLEQQWITQLRKKYPVKVHTKGRGYIINQLQQH